MEERTAEDANGGPRAGDSAGAEAFPSGGPRQAPDGVDAEAHCAICRAVATDQGHWVARDEGAVAFLLPPEDALAPGHMVVAWREHTASLMDASRVALVAVTAVTRRVSRVLTEELDAEGIVVLSASGSVDSKAGAHLHFHVVPCWHDDHVSHWPIGRSRHVLPEGPPVEDRLSAAYARLYAWRLDAGSE